MTRIEAAEARSMSLVSRLFLSHLVVMLVGLMSFLTISKAASHHLFSGHLNRLEGTGSILRDARLSILEGFESAWNSSTLLAVLVGTLTAVGLSYWVAKRIVQPLAQIERTARQFAAGHLSERVLPSNIPEIAQLGNSFNRLASTLEDVESRRRELIGDLTHELRTPLTIVRGYLEVAVSRHTEPSLEICELLVKETRRLERLVNDLQEMSKAESGHLILNFQPLDLRLLLRALVQRFANQLLEDGPILQLDYSPHLPAVLADRDRTEQIMVNLLGNAIHHTAQGTITLRAWHQDYQVWIAIEDTGSGIAPGELPHVFERFWRSDRSRTHYARGTGIGLAITKRLVELQGGQIEVESQLGQGTTFRFSLPVA